jgi:hypothetical protein
MKKQVLLGVAIGIGSFAFAQSSHSPTGVTPAKLKPAVANRTEVYHKNQLPGGGVESFSSIVSSVRNSQHTQRAMAYTTTTIGNTGYQLQTNSSLCNRMVKAADGTMAATWTFSTQQSGWSDRGTGYNYFNGSSWGPAPTARIENVRTGFTNIGFTSAGAEVVVAHEASDLHISTRSAKGTGTWTNAQLGYPDVWSRLAVGGSNGISLHVISQTTGTANPPYMGQDGAIAYSRSLDGGLTWDKVRTVIPQIDASSYLGFGGDAYAIDAKGDTIVIVAGGFDVDVVMIKSVDNGTSWTKTIVHQFAIPLYDAATMDTDIDMDGNADTLESNDASVACLLDNQGKVHVWFGRMRVLEEVGGTAMSYFPGTDGLMYWNETMAPNSPVMITSALDLDGDMVLNVADWGTYQVSLTSQPSAGVDAAGRIYLAYAGIFEGDAENGAPGDGKSYRHTYVMASPDGGMTWCAPVDVTDPPGPTYAGYTEGVYGAMAKDVDGFVRLIVETDAAPGHGVSTATTPDPQSGSADILYKEVPVADVLCPVSVNSNSAISASTMKLFPNPATSVANLELNLAKKGQVTVKIFNVTGQMIAEVANQELAAGKYNFTVNLDQLQAGIYMINMTSADGIVSKKMIVK